MAKCKCCGVQIARGEVLCHACTEEIKHKRSEVVLPPNTGSHVKPSKCWWDVSDKLFHCIMPIGTEWISEKGDDWVKIPKKGETKEEHNDVLLPQMEAARYAIDRLNSGFVKNDSGKLQWSLLPFNELEDVVKVLMHGAKKYSPDNWKKCNDVGRYKDALIRHVIAYVSGDEIDSEFGLSHLAHAICNCLFLLWFDNHKEEKRND